MDEIKSNKRPIKTSIEEIIQYWSVRIDESELSVDFSEAHERCWRCGYEIKLERCHIIPHSLGGQDKAENLVLLCRQCHAEGPNIADPDFFWDWLKAHKATFYDTYWTEKGMREYEFIYKKSIMQEFSELHIYEIDSIEKLMKEQFKKASRHWGQHRMNPATIAGVLRMAIKKLQNKTE